MMDSVEKLGNSKKEGVRGPKSTSPSAHLHPEVLGSKRQMIRVRLSKLSRTFLGFYWARLGVQRMVSGSIGTSPASFLLAAEQKDP